MIARWIPVLAVALVVAAFVGLEIFSDHDDGAPAPESPLPEVYRDLGSHDFGLIVGNVERSHVFRLRNDTEDTWIFRRKLVQCGCLRVDSVTRAVSPGEELVLRTTFSSEGVVGDIARTVNIFMDPDERLFQARILTKVLSEPRAEPAVIDQLVDVEQEEFSVATTIHVCAKGAEVAIAPAEPAAGVEVVIGKRSETPIETLFPVTVKGSMPRRLGELSLHMRFGVQGSPKGDQVYVPVVLRRRRTVAVSPGMMLVSRTAGAGRCEVRDQAGRPARAVTFRTEPEGAARLTYDDGTLEVVPDPAGAGTFDVLVADAGGVRVRVPVHVVGEVVR